MDIKYVIQAKWKLLMILSEKRQIMCGLQYRWCRFKKRLENQNAKNSSVSKLGFPNFLQEYLLAGGVGVGKPWQTLTHSPRIKGQNDFHFTAYQL